MSYLSPDDLNASLYPEIRAAIDRVALDRADGEGGTSLEEAINRALSLIQSKLAPLYDIGKEFAKSGNTRNGLLLGMARDFAIFFLYQLPEKMPVHRYKAYEDSLALLKELARGEGTLIGVDPAPAPTTPAPTVSTGAWGSNPRRDAFY